MAEALHKPDGTAAADSAGRGPSRIKEAIHVLLYGRSGVPTNPVIARILKLSELEPGWNTYKAGKVAEVAQLNAIGLVNSFESHGLTVPLPAAVAALANRGLALVWQLTDREVEIRYFPEGDGDYSITRRSDDEVVKEGRLSSIDPIKDVIEAHVLGRRPLPIAR